MRFLKKGSKKDLRITCYMNHQYEKFIAADPADIVCIKTQSASRFSHLHFLSISGGS